MATARHMAPAHPTTTNASRISIPWMIAFAAIVCFIWGNSLIPGEGSGNLSLAVLTTLESMFDAINLPHEWLTHHFVRKAAHFTEYLVLALVGMQAFHPHRMDAPTRAERIRRVALTAVLLIVVPVLDETIQLFIDDRAGQVRDVLLDCSGEVCGCALTLVIAKLTRRLH